jgi:3-oxoacyl-[acyl-carrier protein] reductase
MDLGLKDRVALVTGASRGLGRATAEALAAEGALLAVVARGANDLATIEEACPGRCIAMPGDLCDPAVPQRAIDTTLARFGRIDIVIVNTGGPPAMQPLEATDADLAKAFETVFYPAVRLIRAAAKPLCERGWGRIVIVSSTSVKGPKAFLSLSAATRSALWAWAKSAAPALYQKGVTINAIFAGPHDTGRAKELGVTGKVIGRADDFGAIVTSLCGEATRFVTGTGHLIDGGEMSAP